MNGRGGRYRRDSGEKTVVDKLKNPEPAPYEVHAAIDRYERASGKKWTKGADEMKKRMMGESREGGPGSGPKKGGWKDNPYSTAPPDPNNPYNFIKKKKEANGMVAPRYDSSHDEGFVDHRYPDLKGNLGQKESREGGPGSGPHAMAARHKEQWKKHDREGIKAEDRGDEKKAAQHGKAAELHVKAYVANKKGSPGAKEASNAAWNMSRSIKHGSGEEGEGQESGKKGWTGRQRDMHKEIGQRISMESRSGSRGPVIINSSPDSPATLPYERPTRENGWRGGIAFSPPAARIKSELEGRLVVKEF